MLVQYWNFINRPLPVDPGPTGFEAIPNFVFKCVLWTIFFSILNFLVPLVLRNVATKWYNELDKRKRYELPSYVVCLVHHFALVPIAWIHIYNDYQLTPEQAAVVQYGFVEATIAPFCVGYLMGDTLCFAIPEALKLRFEYIIHHTLTLWLVLSTIYASSGLNRFIPHLLICDTTNIFFNVAWLLRTAGLRGHPFVTLLEVCFAIVFFFTRVINMPLVFFMITLSSEAVGLGYARFTLLPISLLQWYWFSKIASTMFSRLSGGESETSSASKGAKKTPKKKE